MNVIYAGRRRGTKHPLIHIYVEEGGKEWIFAKPLVSNLGVGYILEVTNPEGQPEQIYTTGKNGPRVVGFAEDDPRVLGWQVEDRAAYQTKANRDAAKRQEERAKDRLLEHHVSALARAAAGLAWSDQEAFIAYVARRIRNGQ